MIAPGELYIIAAPSGAGKTSLVKALTANLANITVSISHTTRPKRPHEEDLVNYYFVSKEVFAEKIQQGDFLEYATIFDYAYGTSKAWVTATLAAGQDVILEIDWQGQQQIKKLFPHAISIFILPPSQQDLATRLTTRNQDSAAVIEKRLADLATSVMHAQEFDYLIVNDDFLEALSDLKAIVKSMRLAKKNQLVRLEKLLSALLAPA